MRPRAWPVFAVFAAAALASILAILAMVVALMVRLMRADRLLLSLPASQRSKAALEILQGYTATIGFHGAVYLVMALVLAGAAYGGARASGERLPEALRLGPASKSPAWIAAALVGLIGWSWALESATAAAGGPPSKADLWIAGALPGSPAGSWAAIGAALLLVDVAQEIFFRGYMQTRLGRCWGAWPAVLVTSATLASIGVSLAWWPYFFCRNVFAGWIVEQTDSVRPAVAMQAFGTLLSLAALTFVPDPFAVRPALGAAGFAAAAVCVVILRAIS